MNLLQLDHSSLRRTAFYPDVPPISLELTSKCNLKCPYCSNGILPRQKKEPYIAWALLEKLVDECAGGQHNLSRLHGTGEPLLWDRLEEAIVLIRSRRAGDAGFATNGTLLTERRIDSLLAAGMTELRVSLDSLDERIYAATRGAKLSKTIANIQNLIRVAPADFVLTIVLMNHKDQEVGEDDVDRFYETFGTSPQVRLEVVENGVVVDSPNDYRRNKSQVESCWRASDWFSITFEGQVSLCCSDQVARHVLGNVSRQTIEEVWYDPDNQAAFRSIAAGVGPCPDTCTQHCFLKNPEPKRRLDANFARPVVDLHASAGARIVAGDFAAARKIIRLLVLRAPRDPTTVQLRKVFEERAGALIETKQKTLASERLALIDHQRSELAASRKRRARLGGRFGIPFFRA